jgi:hypothetical protein
MKFLSICFVALIVIVSSADVPYTNCGNSNDVVKVSSVTANVWPPGKIKK